MKLMNRRLFSVPALVALAATGILAGGHQGHKDIVETALPGTIIPPSSLPQRAASVSIRAVSRPTGYGWKTVRKRPLGQAIRNDKPFASRGLDPNDY